MSRPVGEPGRGGSWVYLSRELLGDLLTVLDAEVAAARSDLGTSGRFAGKALLYFAIAASILIWLPAILGYVLVRVLAQWLPDWGAGLIVLAFFLLLAGGLAAIGWFKAQRVENPVDTVTRRLRAHLGWWRTDVALHTDASGSGSVGTGPVGVPRDEGSGQGDGG